MTKCAAAVKKDVDGGKTAEKLARPLKSQWCNGVLVPGEKRRVKREESERLSSVKSPSLLTLLLRSFSASPYSFAVDMQPHVGPLLPILTQKVLHSASHETPNLPFSAASSISTLHLQPLGRSEEKRRALTLVLLLPTSADDVLNFDM